MSSHFCVRILPGKLPLDATLFRVTLRNFARAKRFSRTLSALAALHGPTRGTASQTIKNLETQGYLTCLRSEADGRSTRFDLTDKGRAMLVNDHF